MKKLSKDFADLLARSREAKEQRQNPKKKTNK